jgi:hypothetical protein
LSEAEQRYAGEQSVLLERALRIGKTTYPDNVIALEQQDGAETLT